MDGSSSAREPHQVSGNTYSFAGPTSGTVARSYNSHNRPCFDLAGVCRLRNDVADVLRELLKIISGPQEHEVPERAGAWLVFPCYFQHVSRANPHIGPPHDGLPDVVAMCCLRNAHVCAGGSSYSQTFVGTTNFTSGRSPSTDWSSSCSIAARVRRSGLTASAPTQLTVPRAHESVLFCE